MKKIKSIAVLLCICMILPRTPLAKANEKQGAETWKLSDIELSHTSLSFQISSVDKAQEAILFVQTSDSDSSTKEEDIITYEIPFTITSSTENITVDIPDGGYLTPEHYYDISVKDADGNETSKSKKYLSKHKYGYWIYYKTYPNWVEVENDNYGSCHVSATVGFQEYKIDLGGQEKGVIEYPTQTVGTTIELKWWDDYGCSGNDTKKVENEYLKVPSVFAWKDSITARNPYMSENERIAVEVEGKTYYSSYGAANKIIPDFVTYPQVADSTSKIKIWLESKNGSKSEEKECDIRDCDLNACKITCSPFQAQATGNVEANEYGHSIIKVATTIDGKEYSCDVTSDGTFCLEYPDQKNSSSITIQFIDKHGCNISKEYSIINVLRYQKNRIVILPSRAYADVYDGTRIAVKIGEQIYYSDYAPNTDSLTETTRVTVSYPLQKPGKEMSVWYEKANTSKSPIYNVVLDERIYEISADDVRTSTITGNIKNDFVDFNVYVQVNGVEYKANLNKNAENKHYITFSCNYPKQKVGNTVKVIVRDNDGYECSKTFVMNNIKPKINLKKIDTSTTRVQGTTVAGSAVTIKIKNKTYTGKADKNGNFSIKIKPKKTGTKVTVNVVSPEGYTNSKTTKISKVDGYAELSNYVFYTSTKAKLTVRHGSKGDKLKVKIGGRTYTKKLKSNKKKQKITIKIKKAAAGSKIKITLFDKYGAKKGAESGMVYYGNAIYVGMSARNATLTTWGSPVRRNNWGTGYEQWVFESANSTVYAYIKNGKVFNLQHLNY